MANIGSPNVLNSDLPTGTNVIGGVSIDQTTPGTTNGVQVNAALPAGSNLIGKVDVNFAGAVYRDKDVAAADTARRFETTSKKLRNVTILVSGYAQYFGTSATQDYPANPGDTLAYDYIDISTLYFKNVTAGQNGTVNILGVEE